MSEPFATLVRFGLGCLVGAAVGYGLYLSLGGLSPYHVMMFAALCGCGYVVWGGERSNPT